MNVLLRGKSVEVIHWSVVSYFSSISTKSPSFRFQFYFSKFFVGWISNQGIPNSLFKFTLISNILFCIIFFFRRLCLDIFYLHKLDGRAEIEYKSWSAVGFNLVFEFWVIFVWKKKRVDATFKLIVLGDYGIGKSSLIQRFAQNTFTGENPVTLGHDFLSKVHEINGKKTKIVIWDSAGQEVSVFVGFIAHIFAFISLALSNNNIEFLSRCQRHFIIIFSDRQKDVHKCTRKWDEMQNFLDIFDRFVFLDWLFDINTNKGNKAVVYLVGSKSDLIDNRVIEKSGKST